MSDFDLNVSDPVHKTATGTFFNLSVVGDGSEVFHRRAIKLLPDGQRVNDSMLVGRLNGVSLYIKDNELVLTTADLYL
jgi:hypothetical protein